MQTSLGWNNCCGLEQSQCVIGIREKEWEWLPEMGMACWGRPSVLLCQHWSCYCMLLCSIDGSNCVPKPLCYWYEWRDICPGFTYSHWSCPYTYNYLLYHSIYDLNKGYTTFLFNKLPRFSSTFWEKNPRGQQYTFLNHIFWHAIEEISLCSIKINYDCN